MTQQTPWMLTVSFAELLQRLHAQKHTGPVTLHFLHGRPKLVDLPSEPMQIALDSEESPSQT